jgi:hypothetical protein
MTPTYPRLHNIAWHDNASIGQARVRNWIENGDSRIPLNMKEVLDFNLLLTPNDFLSVCSGIEAAAVDAIPQSTVRCVPNAPQT